MTADAEQFAQQRFAPLLSWWQLGGMLWAQTRWLIRYIRIYYGGCMMQEQGRWQPRKPAPGYDMPEYTGAPLKDTEIAQVRETLRDWAGQNVVIAKIMEARGGKMPSDWKQRVDDAGLRARPPH